MDRFLPILEAVSANIHRVGERPGDGQTVKACLQSLIGAQFSATFEAAALAAKAGVSGQVLLDVFSTSSAGCGVVNNALEKIIDRQFEGTGSHINTMHKDLTIAMASGRGAGRAAPYGGLCDANFPRWEKQSTPMATTGSAQG